MFAHRHSAAYALKALFRFHGVPMLLAFGSLASPAVLRAQEQGEEVQEPLPTYLQEDGGQAEESSVLENPAARLGVKDFLLQEEAAVRSLELFPLLQFQATQAVTLIYPEIEERLSKSAVFSKIPERFRNQVSSLPVMRNISPYEVGDWVLMPDGSATYVLVLNLEQADRIRVRFSLTDQKAPRAFVVAYADAQNPADDLRGPTAFLPDEESMVLVPSMDGSTIHVEVRQLPAEWVTPSDQPPFLIHDVQYYADDLSRFLNPDGMGPQVTAESPAGSAFLPVTVCSGYTDVNCVSAVSGVKNGVVQLNVDFGGAGTAPCSGSIIRDNEASTDIPYILTAGHCVENDLRVTEIYFWNESSSCNSSGSHSWRQSIAPRIFELAWNSQPRDCPPDNDDWALLRFNLIGEVSHTPTFLTTKTTSQPFGDKVYQVHHPGNGFGTDRKKFSQGDLSWSGTYTQEYDYDTGYFAEGGASGSPVFDEDDLTVIGVHNCGADCSSGTNARMTRFGHVASQISRFLNPTLATPSISGISAPSTAQFQGSFLVTITVRNSGSHTSTDGHIHVAFPSYTSAADTNLVTVDSKSSDLTYEEYAAGFSGLGRRNGSLDPSANYLHIESRDNSWSPNEENFLTLRVTPKALGAMQIWYRAAMRSENEYYYGTPSDSSYDVIDSDQGWPERQVVVTISSGAPAVTTSSASGVGQTTATLNGVANPNGSSTNAYFEWGLTTGYGNTTSSQNIGSGASGVSYSRGISGLACNTQYHFRAVANNSGGTGMGLDQTFTTSPCTIPPPTVTTNGSSGVGQTSATLHGVANPNGSSTNAYFEWGLTTGYGNTTSSQNVGSGTSSVSYSRGISGLACNTQYHFRAVANNSGGTGTGLDQTFTTSPCTSQAPAVTTNNASGVGQTSATLNGTVNPNGLSTTAYFEWGTTPSYGNTTTAQNVGSGSSGVAYSQAVSGLSCNTQYHFRAVAGNTGGSSGGVDMTFTTRSCSSAGGQEYFTVFPCRVVDTRSAPSLQNELQYSLQVAGYCGIPFTAVSVVANVTIVAPTSYGHLKIWPWDLSEPPTSVINFSPNQIRANNAVVMLATDGFGDIRIKPYVSGNGALHFIMDVMGYFQ